MKVTVAAKVTFEFHFHQPYGDDWKIGDIVKTARKDAEVVAVHMAQEINSCKVTSIEVNPDIKLITHREENDK